MLGAKRVFAFSPQFDIEKNLCALSGRLNYEKGYGYTNLVNLCEKTPVYYFYPCRAKWDMEQSILVTRRKNVFKFPVLSNLHGKAVYANNMPNLLDMDEENLMKLRKKFENKEKRPLVISLYLVGLKKVLKHG